MLLHMLMLIGIYLIAGFLTGLLSALFGIGGGLVVVPVLFMVFHFIEHIPSSDVMHVAVGTSLAVMVITALNSAYHHARTHNIVWAAIKPMSLYLAIGVILGSVLAHWVHSDFLRILFVCMLVGIFLQAILRKGFISSYQLQEFSLPPLPITALVSLCTGLLSVLVGVGGSVMTLPFLRKCKMPMKNASACAVTLTLIVALIGAGGYLLAGLNYKGQLPTHCVGFINIPAFLGISIGTFVGVPFGISFHAKVSDQLLAKSYLLLLIIIIGMMLA